MNNLRDWFEKIYLMDMNEIGNSFESIGEGLTRKVFAINDQFVIKMSKCKCGDSQSKLESRIFSHSSKNIKSYLCPVIWYKDDMLVMRRAVPLSQFETEPVVNFTKIRPGFDAYRDMTYLSKKYNLIFNDILSTSSWGLIDNIPVLVDYGCQN